MKITLFDAQIPDSEMRELMADSYGDMLKGVVDIDTQCIGLGGELHADIEVLVLEHGSQQSNLWGFNIYPDKLGDDRIQYTSFINIRPRDGNRDIEVKDQDLQLKMKDIIFAKLGWV